jgi:hypothetical protein
MKKKNSKREEASLNRMGEGQPIARILSRGESATPQAEEDSRPYESQQERKKRKKKFQEAEDGHWPVRLAASKKKTSSQEES